MAGLYLALTAVFVIFALPTGTLSDGLQIKSALEAENAVERSWQMCSHRQTLGKEPITPSRKPLSAGSGRCPIMCSASHVTSRVVASPGLANLPPSVTLDIYFVVTPGGHVRTRSVQYALSRVGSSSRSYEGRHEGSIWAGFLWEFDPNNFPSMGSARVSHYAVNGRPVYFKRALVLSRGSYDGAWENPVTLPGSGSTGFESIEL